MSKTALLVARVSTDTQAKHGYSLPTQLAGMREYATRMGFVVAGEITDDCSGTIPIFDRPGGKEVYLAIQARRVDAIIFYTIDRASRDEDVIDFITLKRALREAGIELHFCDTGKSEFDSVTGIIEYIKVSEAGREKRKITERNSRGKRAKAEAGLWVGVGTVPYGYKKVGERRQARLKINKAETAIVQRIFSLYIGETSAPMGTTAIARLLTSEQVPTPAHGRFKKKALGWYDCTIKNILTRRAYLGEFEEYGFAHTWPELAVIPPATFQRAQEILERNRRGLVGNYTRINHYLLSGFCDCTCGHGLNSQPVINKQGRRYVYYRCYHGRKTHYTDCNAPYLRIETLDNAAWKWVTELLSASDRLEQGLTEYQRRCEDGLQGKRQQLVDLQAEIREAGHKVKTLAVEFGNEKDEFVRAVLREQRDIAARQRQAAMLRQGVIEQELADGELSAKDIETIRQWAKVITDELAGDWEVIEKRDLLTLLDFRGKLEYRDGALGIAMTCGIKPDGEWQGVKRLQEYSKIQTAQTR